MNNKYTGIIVPLVTPMDKQQNIDKEALTALIDKLNHSGVHGLFAGGTIGEFPSLTTEELGQLCEILVENARESLPVFIGAGSNNTKVAIKRIKILEDKGADVAVVVNPFYITLNDKSLVEHYTRIAESTELPILIYNIPGYTGQEIPVPVITKLDQNCDSIIGIKDSSGNMGYTNKIIRNTSEDFLYLQGLDNLLLPSLIIGAQGGVNGTANIEPKFIVNLYESFQSGNLERAKTIQLEKVDPLVEACSVGQFPDNFKKASKSVGLDVGDARLPVTPLSEEQISKQRKLLDKLDLIN